MDLFFWKEASAHGRLNLPDFSKYFYLLTSSPPQSGGNEFLEKMTHEI